MNTTMVRKQVYVERRQDRKLKALARVRGCSEAAILRDAIDQLPEPDVNVIEQLASAGFLAPTPVRHDLPIGDDLVQLESSVAAFLAGLSTPIGFSAAVDADREES